MDVVYEVVVDGVNVVDVVEVVVVRRWRVEVDVVVEVVVDEVVVVDVVPVVVVRR